MERKNLFSTVIRFTLISGIALSGINEVVNLSSECDLHVDFLNENNIVVCLIENGRVLVQDSVGNSLVLPEIVKNIHQVWGSNKTNIFHWADYTGNFYAVDHSVDIKTGIELSADVVTIETLNRP